MTKHYYTDPKGKRKMYPTRRKVSDSSRAKSYWKCLYCGELIQVGQQYRRADNNMVSHIINQLTGKCINRKCKGLDALLNASHGEKDNEKL